MARHDAAVAFDVVGLTRGRVEDGIASEFSLAAKRTAKTVSRARTFAAFIFQ
ncbi:hypothetical protein ACLOJK_017901 [Asimina triloba]